jgi:hypothetical protein
LLTGFGLVIGGIVLAVRGVGGLGFPIVMLIGGSILGGGGVWLYYFMNKPIVFDKDSGYFWKGRKDPQQALMPEMSKDFVRLKDIHAIQLLSEECMMIGRSGSGSGTREVKIPFYSYEINLVLEDGSRMNVIDQGNLNRIRADAKTLAQFLEVPLWDAT